ncbi:glycosyltransferase, partial [Geminicoccus harenae]
MTGLVVIASGGTGGHMFPALALADEIVRRGHQVALVVDERGRRWVKGTYDVHVVAAARPGLGAVGRGLGVAQGLLQCLRLLRRW